jgi:class 3 adenylate cyclase
VTEDTMSGEPAPPTSGADIRTFLFADMRGYTRFTQDNGDDAASALASRFAEVVRVAAPDFDGELLELRGDEALCVFASPRKAVRAAVGLQRRLRAPSTGEPFPLGVGIGLDVGEAVPTEGGYRGRALNFAARLCSVAKGGEILVSEGLAHVAHPVTGARFQTPRPMRLKGVRDPVRVVSVEPEQPLPPIPADVRSKRRLRRWVVAVAAIILALVIAVGARLITSGGSGTPISPPAGVVRIDARTGQKLLTIGLPESGAHGVNGVAVGDGFVWVADATGVAKIDPGTNRVVKQIPVSDSGGHLGFGFNKLWVEDTGSYTNAVSVIDPRLGTIIGHRGLQPYGGSSYVFGYDTVWAMDTEQPAAAYRIDPNGSAGSANGSYRIVGRIPNAGAVAIGPEGVWDTNGGLVGAINPRTDKVHVVPALVPGGDTIAVGAGAVWVVSGVNLSVSEINPGTGRLIPPAIPFAHGAPAEVAASVISDGALWLCDDSRNEVLKIDLSNRRVAHVTKLPDKPSGLAVDGNTVWVTYAPQGAASAL